MSNPISRRTVLAGSAAAAAVVSLPALPAYAHGRPSTAVTFTLNAEVLDGGEQVTSITLDTSRLGPIDARDISTDAFSVHATATLPKPLDEAGQVSYDVDRTITGVEVDHRGRIVLRLDYGEGKVGGSTLAYLVDQARNVVADLDYTIVQRTPIGARGHRQIMINKFEQGRLSDPEVDAFSYHVSDSGMNYRLYSPRGGSHYHRRSRRPLIIWLHGAGEGGMADGDYYDNETLLRANRGALGFATDEAQRIFGGAYVVAPQCPRAWMDDGPRFAPLIQEIIDEVSRRHPIDHDQVQVVGCSNGGYMTMKMTTVYPDEFAAAVPICGVVQSLTPGGPRLITDAELGAISTPTWLVASKDDPVVDPVANTEHAHDLIPHSLMSLYDHVIWNGYQFLGHFSWIYVARNDPRQHGMHIWQWMARQRR
ncbi:prolyl oligopeptidase family serine peptidase [Microlunatus elymi]|uniref:Prolyl oligopeptidase family serine peptidase n=1 Tax=Microlunatus elymi TaxID=2596828 RepID=A0A516PUA3_9ACTN|nr:prolyl oligopeptidase family serine peptidase [Microlunatus elymi]QDP94776.1 prolyl oligopeptidase family serine peptidase [Microlunatus elymi]